MKFSKILSLSFALLACLLPLATNLPAANYYFDPSAANSSLWFNTLWATPGNVGPYNQAWDNTAANNNVANFTTNSTDVNYNVFLGGQTVNFGSGGVVWNPTGSSVTLAINENTPSGFVFDGGTINAGPNAGFVTRIFPTVSGNFTVTQGFLELFSAAAYTGSATVNTGAFLYFNSLEGSSSSSNVAINGGTLWLRGRSGVREFGALSGSSGTVSMRVGPSNAGVNLQVRSLNGTATVLVETSATSINSTLTVNQTSSGTEIFSGSIGGKSNQHRLALVKSGNGTLTLTGSAIDFYRETAVNGGTLLINGGTIRYFENEQGSAAFRVSDGGTLGGTSTLSVHGGDDVLVENGGALAAGNGIGVAGRTTFSFAAGGSFDLSGVSAETAWLKFDLGADSTPGTTYDQIRITNGTFSIGSSLLNFNDFEFTTLSGFDEGVYTLFDLTGSSTISGSLGSSLSGAIPGGYFGTLSQSGENLILTVIPEPGSALLSLLGLAAVAYRRRKRR